MKKFFIIASVALGFAACKQGNKIPMLAVDGTFTNTGANKIYLAELPFGSQERTVVDTATLDAKGHFELSTPAKGEGVYQLFVENGPGIMLINDVDKLEFTGDANHLSQYTIKGGTANADLKNLYANFLVADSTFQTRRAVTDSLYQNKASDSLFAASRQQTDVAFQQVQTVLNNFISKESNATAVYFALGIAKAYNEPEQWDALLQTSLKKFPNHPGIALLKLPAPSEGGNDDYANEGKEWLNKPVPQISLPDTSGKIISVNSFKGKWLLMDFWASWCGPCRQENPNVVAAYKQFKSKNFSILGVSLDKEKGPWLKAIQKDGLTWNHVSDLKYWDSQAVKTYNLSAIPFNMLVDPDGKVVAVNLTGEKLQATLGQYVK
jgi:peroxiredoxin